MKIETAFVNDIEMPYFSFGTGERAFIILPGDSAKSITISARAIEAAYKQFGEKYTVYAFDRRRNMPAEQPSCNHIVPTVRNNGPEAGRASDPPARHKGSQPQP